MSSLQTMGGRELASGPFSHRRYTIKRPWLTFLGRKFYVYDESGQLVVFVQHKILTFKDEWNMFADEAMQRPLLRVKAKKAIALDSVSDITDAQTGMLVGSVRNKGLKSIVRDTWELMGDVEQPIGKFVEDSSALLRRFIPLLRGHWHVERDGRVVAKLDQLFRFFGAEMTLEIVEPGVVDPRLVVACAMLAVMREVVREQA